MKKFIISLILSFFALCSASAAIIEDVKTNGYKISKSAGTTEVVVSFTNGFNDYWIVNVESDNEYVQNISWTKEMIPLNDKGEIKVSIDPSKAPLGKMSVYLYAVFDCEAQGFFIEVELVP